MTTSRLLFYVSVVVLLFSSDIQQCCGQETTTQYCRIEFTVDEGQSAIAFSGDVVKPFPIAFSMANEDVIAQGLRGGLVATVDGPCPTSGDALVRGLFAGGVTLRTADRLLEYYPANVTVRHAS